MDHLEQAKIHAGQVLQVTGGVDWAQLEAQLAITHAAIALTETVDGATNALIAIVERLPRPAETWSECIMRLRKEEQDGL